MRKNIAIRSICSVLTIGFLFLGLLLLVPGTVSAAYNDLQFTEATNLYMTSPAQTIVVSAGAKVATLVVNATNIVITGAYTDASNTSTITLTSSDLVDFANDWGLTTTCGSTSSTLTITWTASSSSSITVTPGSACTSISSGGGGGGVVIPTVPTTTTGEVTVTPADGGKTILTTATGTKATIEVPAGTVSAETVFEVAPVTTGTLATIAPTPSGENLVTAFNLTAVAGTVTQTSFEKSITVSISYTDSQIAGLDESTLKIYRWDGTKWVALTSTVDAATNTVTATTMAFSYFGVMGELKTTTGPGTQMTVDQLKAEIIRITALIVQLQSELNKLIGAPAIVNCATFSFNKNLEFGMTGADIKCLQIFLNKDSDTQVAASGVGSSGKETILFGALTKAAVIKFQEKYASEILKPLGIEGGTGFVGTSTRAKINKLLSF